MCFTTTSVYGTVAVFERLEAEVQGERGTLQEPGIAGRNAHQASRVAEADGLGLGEIIFSFFLST